MIVLDVVRHLLLLLIALVPPHFQGYLAHSPASEIQLGLFFFPFLPSFISVLCISSAESCHFLVARKRDGFLVMECRIMSARLREFQVMEYMYVCRTKRICKKGRLLFGEHIEYVGIDV